MTTNTGYLILADISGFSSYLADVELTHAEQILQELYEVLARQLRPYVTDALVEGGALFGHIPDPQAPKADAMLDFVETGYAMFRHQLLTLQQNTTCTCRACKNIATLDLKFFVHHGEYLLHQVGSQMDMMGLDVSLIRSRVLKAPVVEQTHWDGLALFTAPALAQLGLDSTLLPFHTQTVTFEPYGPIATYSLDLKSRYEAQSAANPVVVQASEADISHEVELPVPPAIAWAWLTLPERRSQWTAGRHWTARERPKGRMSAGASNHCDHRSGHVVELILDWRPFEHVTSQLTIHPGGMKARNIYTLIPLPNNHTLVVWRMALDVQSLFKPILIALMRPMLRRDLQRLCDLIQAEKTVQ